MAATVKADVNFVPKVWSDHINAYFDRKMGLGQLALVDKTLQSRPGETVTFPYFAKIGAAEEPAESASLTVDNLEDNSFSCTVKEIGKAVGWKDAAIRKSAASRDAQEAEAQRQIGQVFAEKVDSDIQTLINNGANYFDAFNATTDVKLTVAKLLELKILAFGDKSDQAVACSMHSLHFLTLMNDSTAGFLKADANDPFYGMPGFMGRILGMALFVLDTSLQTADVATKKAFAVHVFKAQPFGIYMAEDMKPEQDRDILARESIVSSTMWYGTLGLHGKVSADDKRIGRGTYTTDVAA